MGWIIGWGELWSTLKLRNRQDKKYEDNDKDKAIEIILETCDPLVSALCSLVTLMSILSGKFPDSQII